MLRSVPVCAEPHQVLPLSSRLLTTALQRANVGQRASTAAVSAVKRERKAVDYVR
jgi:hypothetical protein